ncbi:MAG: toll/interleukin-1 receptor domain-containing protein [Muribaculaceae bacterium]|nr:toll/interleukin-1 receptor domain-containing protein [Muribaculaceae bacterium]
MDIKPCNSKEKKYNRMFISYKRKNKELVFPLKDRLEKEVGENCWIDLDGIESDAQFVSVIMKAINECEIFLFMYSRLHNSITDYEEDWTIRELQFAKSKGKKIVFLNLDRSELGDWFSFMFGQKQQVDVLSEEALNRLFSDLKGWLKVENNSQIEESKEKIIPEKTKNENSYPNEIEELLKDVYHENLNEFKVLIPDALKGDTKAQFELGMRYLAGEGVDENLKNAVDWLKTAANNGLPEAQYTLGLLYQNGKGVDKDINKSISWYKRAANQGNTEAQIKLGLIYYCGKEGIEEDKQKAVNWFTKAAMQDDSNAQYLLGNYFSDKENPEFNIPTAMEWYSRSGAQDNEKALLSLGLLYFYGETGIKKNQWKAFALIKKASKLGNQQATQWLNENIYTNNSPK